MPHGSTITSAGKSKRGLPGRRSLTFAPQVVAGDADRPDDPALLLEHQQARCGLVELAADQRLAHSILDHLPWRPFVEQMHLIPTEVGQGVQRGGLPVVFEGIIASSAVIGSTSTNSLNGHGG